MLANRRGGWQSLGGWVEREGMKLVFDMKSACIDVELDEGGFGCLVVMENTPSKPSCVKFHVDLLARE